MQLTIIFLWTQSCSKKNSVVTVWIQSDWQTCALHMCTWYTKAMRSFTLKHQLVWSKASQTEMMWVPNDQKQNGDMSCYVWQMLVKELGRMSCKNRQIKLYSRLHNNPTTRFASSLTYSVHLLKTVLIRREKHCRFFYMVKLLIFSMVKGGSLNAAQFNCLIYTGNN